jgi:hypothetical protein
VNSNDNGKSKDQRQRQLADRRAAGDKDKMTYKRQKKNPLLLSSRGFFIFIDWVDYI